MSDVRCAECDCTDGNCNWIMSAGEQAAHEEGRKAGLEQAAAWHDAEARQFEWQWVEILKLPLPNPVADKHREYAATLRAMKDKP